jgi:hypothetical protein
MIAMKAYLLDEVQQSRPILTSESRFYTPVSVKSKAMERSMHCNEVFELLVRFFSHIHNMLFGCSTARNVQGGVMMVCVL